MHTSLFRSRNPVSFSAAQSLQEGWSMSEPLNRGHSHIFAYSCGSNCLRTIAAGLEPANRGENVKR